MTKPYHELIHTRRPIPVYAVHPTPGMTPLAFGLLVGYAREKLAQESYDLTFRLPTNRDEWAALLAEHGPGVCLFSHYIWNDHDNLALAAWVKEQYPQSLVIFGGPSAPSYREDAQQWLQQHPYVDFAVNGEGERTLTELLQHVASSQEWPLQVAGLSFLVDGAVVQTPPRERTQDPNEFPSPYLNGLFDQVDSRRWDSATLESNRGCPYGCTFCDWGAATRQKIRQFDLERVRQELNWISAHQIGAVWVADANFGIFPRDVEITRMICELKEQTGYPNRLVTNYAKNTHQHLIDIIELLIDHGLIGQGIISLQTRDPGTLAAVNRSNIKADAYDKLQAEFTRKKLPMSSQLMLGLPGSTPETFKTDLRFFFQRPEIEVQIYRTVVLPNSPMAAPPYRQKYAITYDDQGVLLSHNTYSQAELNRMEQLARLFRCSSSYGMFHYVLQFLQWDYGIDPIDFLESLLLHAVNNPEYAWLSQLEDHDALPTNILHTHVALREKLRAQADWQAFYRELKQFILVHYPQVQDAADLGTVLAVHEAVMPAHGKPAQFTLALAHDYVAYDQAHKADAQSTRPLARYAPAEMLIQDPLGLSEHALFAPRKPGMLAASFQLVSPLTAAMPHEYDVSAVRALAV